MGELLYKKKYKHALMIKSTSDAQKAKLKAEIDKLQEQAKKKMGQVEKYNQDHVPEAIYVFITF